MTEQAKLTVTKSGRGVKLQYGTLAFFGSKARVEALLKGEAFDCTLETLDRINDNGGY